eukprot:3516339-Amphidinium_carterae.1
MLAPQVVGPHHRVVTYNTFARCLDCHRQTGLVKGKFNFTYLRGQACRVPSPQEKQTGEAGSSAPGAPPRG